MSECYCRLPRPSDCTEYLPPLQRYQPLVGFMSKMVQAHLSNVKEKLDFPLYPELY